MGLSNKKEEQLRKQPIVECKLAKSKDGRFIVHRTVITDIKPVEYYKVVMDKPGIEDVKEEAVVKEETEE